MNAKIFSFVKVSDSSIVASVRIARFIRDTLGIPVCWEECIAEQPLDVLLIVNGAYAFSGSGLLGALGKAIDEAKRVVWIQNDYTIIPPKDQSGAESPFRKAFRMRHDRKAAKIDYWTTCEAMSMPGVARTGHHIGTSSCYINWNCLTTDIREPKPHADRIFPKTLLYYGSHRKERVRYFDRYFKTPSVDTLISCPNKKFQENYHGLRIIHETKLEDVYGYLGECGLGLYLEDRRSHDEFHSPANRFYEMLSAGLPMVFQPESIRMMKKAGYDISDWILWKAEEIEPKMDAREQILEQQRRAFVDHVMMERNHLPHLVNEAWKRVSA